MYSVYNNCIDVRTRQYGNGKKRLDQSVNAVGNNFKLNGFHKVINEAVLKRLKKNKKDYSSYMKKRQTAHNWFEQ